jgi:secreted trypsin-like serine protease
MRTALRRTLVAAAVGVAALVSATVPSAAITGGTEDTANTYSNVGLIVFYQPDGRFRCSGTLVAPQVVLTAAHCTYLDIGKVAVSFDPVIARTPDEAERDVPRAADDSGPDDAVSEIGFTEADVTAPAYEGEQTWVLGTPLTHPDYSDFTDLENWNDTGVIILDEPVALPTSPLAPENYLDQFEQPVLNSTEFLTVGYGTEVRQAEEGPQQPAPQRLPLVRRYTTEVGQKLTDQVLQLNGNEHDPRAGGGTCFGDSGGPAFHEGYVVGDTSYGYTNNCRYLGGYQRVDIPVVRDWLLDCMADLACATKA